MRRNGGKAGIETFVVGQDIEKGERLQWVVEGGKYKGTFLLPDDGGSSNGLLISEVGPLYHECGMFMLTLVDRRPRIRIRRPRLPPRRKDGRAAHPRPSPGTELDAPQIKLVYTLGDIMYRATE